MKRYAVKVLNEGKYKFYYILDNETCTAWRTAEII